MSEGEQTPPGGSTAAPVGSGAHGPVSPEENYYTTPQYSTQPVVVRRPDSVAGLLLLLAGIAAGISLLLRWVEGSDDRGWDLVRRGFDSFGDLFDTGFWQPLAIVLGGGALFVLGLLMFVPARTHRALGILALVVSGLVIAGVLVPLADEGWSFAAFALGFWFAIAVAVLGLLGALKAVLTGPRYATQPALT